MSHLPLEKIGAATLMATSWVIGLGDIETVVRISSLMITTSLSVLMFLRNRKKENKDEEGD